jgi:hypothetical protein
VTSKTEGKVDTSHMLVKYDARLRDNVAVNVVQEVTDTVQVAETGQHVQAGTIPTGIGKVSSSGSSAAAAAPRHPAVLSRLGSAEAWR